MNISKQPTLYSVNRFATSLSFLAALVAGGGSCAYAAGPLPANALPTGGQVVAGSASIDTAGNTMNINQSSQRAVINWNTFDVGKGATVNFNQPNAQAATLNYVNSASKSMINGAVNANGQVIFVNNNGVVFGKHAEVNVGGMVATTMNVDRQKFMAGESNLTFTGNGSGAVVNKGRIIGNNIDSYIALMAPSVKNTGVIIATMSAKNTIALVAGEKVSLTFSGSQLVNVSVDASTVNALISNKLLIQTNGGQVIIAANAAQDLIGSTIKNTGQISASGISKSGGTVKLVADTVVQAGEVGANSDAANAGQVVISGNSVTLASGSKTTATGVANGGEILIGKTNLNTTQSQVNAKVLSVEQGALVDASSTQSGNGGNISVWSQIATNVAGIFKSNGGAKAGNGGTVDTSSAGKVTYGMGLTVETTASNGKIGSWITYPLTMIIDSTTAGFLSNALSKTNVILDAPLASCGGIGACSNSAGPLISFLAGTNVYSSNPNTSLTLNAAGGTINFDGTVAVGQVYAVAQTINVNGSIGSTSGSNGSIYLAGAGLNILGSIGSNGSSQSSGSQTNIGGSNSTTRRNNGVNGALASDANVYTSNAGVIHLLATGDINLGSNSYISANGQNGGTINIVSTDGNVSANGVIDAIGKVGSGGQIAIVGKTQTEIIGALIAADGQAQRAIMNIGLINTNGSGSTLAPPATAPPLFINHVISIISGISSSSIISGSISISGQAGLSASNGKMVIFAENIEFNSSKSIADQGMIVIGREDYASGGLTIHTKVVQSYFRADYVETSAKYLETGINTVLAKEWLLDPVNVTISSSGPTTGGSLNSALGNAGNVTITTTDIQNAINAGTSVNIIATGSITQSNALSFSNNSGVAATLTFDNRSGNRQAINLAAISATGSQAVNVVAYSAGGVITSGGAISVNGSVTFDNTFAVNGTQSGFINKNNLSTYATTNLKGVVINAAISAGKDILINAVNNSSGPSGAVEINANLSSAQATAGGVITIDGQNTNQNGIYVPVSVTLQSGTSSIVGGDITLTAYDAHPTNSAIYGGGRNLNISTYGSSVFIGRSENPITGATGINDVLGTITARKVAGAGGNVSLYATATNSTQNAINNASPIDADGTITIVGTSTATSTSAAVVSLTGAITLTSAGANNLLSITGNTATGAGYTGSSTGVSVTGAINLRSNGGSASFISNNSISQTNTVTVAPNTSGTASAITYDITAGNKSSSISVGTLSLTGGVSASNTDINFVVKTSGAAITVGAISVPGSITLDNTYLNGLSGGITVANGATYATTASGVSINGVLSAGNAVNISGITSYSTATTSISGVQMNSSIYSSQRVSGGQLNINANASSTTGSGSLVAGTNAVMQSGTSSIVGGDINLLGTTNNINATGYWLITGGNDITAYGASINAGTSASPLIGGFAFRNSGNMMAISRNGIGGGINIYATSTSIGGFNAISSTGTITADASVTVVGNRTVDYNTPAVSLTGNITLNNVISRRNLSITGNNVSATGYQMVNVTGIVQNNSSGGSIDFVSNGSINQTNTVAVAPNTSGTSSAVTYNTTTGNKSSTITTGALSLTGGGASASTSGINYVVITSGASITVGAVTVPGIISLDNTYLNGVQGQIVSSNASTLATSSNGIQVNGALSASNISNAAVGININGVTSGGGNGAVYIAASDLTANGNVTITGVNTGTASGIYINASNITSNNGSINLYGSTTNTSAIAGNNGVYIRNTSQYLSAQSDINIAGYSSATANQQGIYQGGLLLAGRDISLGGYGGAGGIWLGTPGTIYAGRNFVAQNASINSTGVASLASGYATATGTNAHGVAITSGTTGTTVASGPNQGTFTGFSVVGSATIAGQNSSATGTGYGVWLGQGLGNFRAGSWNISAKNGGTNTHNTFLMNAGTLTSTVSNISISAINTSSANATIPHSGVVVILAPIVSAGSVSIASTGTSQTNGINNANSITAAGGVSIIASGPTISSGDQNRVVVSGAITNTGGSGTGVVVSSVGNTSLSTITNNGSLGVQITGGYGVAAGTTTFGTITALGSVTNTAGLVKLSMANLSTSFLIEIAAGLPQANAVPGTNLTFAQVGGAMADLSAPVSINYRISPQFFIRLRNNSFTKQYSTDDSTALTNFFNSTNNPFSYTANWTNGNSTTGQTSFTTANGGTFTFTLGTFVWTYTRDQVRTAIASASIGNRANYGTVASEQVGTYAYNSVIPNTLFGGTFQGIAANNTNTPLALSQTIAPMGLLIGTNSNSQSYTSQLTYAQVFSSAGVAYGTTTVNGVERPSLATNITLANGVVLNDTVTSLTHTYTSGTDIATAANFVSTYGTGSPIVNPSTAIAQAGQFTVTPSNAVIQRASGGSANANYIIYYQAGSQTVNPGTININGATTNVGYNATQRTNGAPTISGLAGSDTLSITGGMAVGTNAGTYTDALTYTGTGLSNYTITVNPGTLTITPAPIVITATDTIKTYNAATTVTGATLAPTPILVSGNLYGATLSGGTYAYTDPNAGSGNKTVTVADVAVNNGLNVVTGNYSITYVNNTTSTINPAQITINGTSVYNGTNSATYLTAAGVAGQTLTINGGTATMNSANAGTNAITSLSGGAISAGGTNPGNISNYTLTNPILGNVVVSPAPITVTASDVIKTYDASLSTSSASVTQAPTPVLVAGTLYTNSGIQDSLSGGTYAYTDANAGVGNKTVTIASVGIANSATGNTAATNNYTITYINNTTSTINPKQLTASIVGDPTMTYNATTANTGLTSSNYSLSGFVGSQGASVTGATSGNYNSPNVLGATSITAGLTPSSFTANAGTNLSNYILPTSATGTGHITPAPLTVTANSAAGFVGTNIANNGLTVTGLQGADTAATALASSSIANNAPSTAPGTYTGALVPSATPNPNYSIASLVPGNLSIAAAGQLIISAGTGSVVYGTYNTSNVATAADTVSSTVTAGYCTNCAVGMTAAPNIVSLAVTPPSSSGTVWTATDSIGVGTSAQGIYNFNITPTIPANSYSTGNNLKVGTYALVPNSVSTVAGKSTNYDTNLPVIYNPGALTVTPLTLNFAQGPTATYNGSTNLAGASITPSNKVAGDTLTVTGSGTLSSPNANAGGASYALNSALLTGPDAANYIFSPSAPGASGTNATVLPAAITVTASNAVKTYDTTTATIGSSVTTLPKPVLVSGTLFTNTATGVADALSSVVTVYYDANPANAPNVGSGNKTLQVNNAVINNGAVDATSNYTITYINNTTSTVNPAPLTVSGLYANNKVYSGTTAATIGGTPTLTGALAGAPVTISGGTVTQGTFADPNAANNIGVTPDFSSLALSNSNYILVGPTVPLLASITPAPLTISGLTAADIVYNGATATTISGTASLAGAITGTGIPSVSLVGGSSITSGNFAGANVIYGGTVTPDLTGVSLSGPGASNYTLMGTTSPLTANITPKPLTVTLASQTKVYDANANAALTAGTAGNPGSYVISGFLSGQGAYITQTAGAYNTANVATANSVTANLVPTNFVANTGTLLSNYSLPTTATGVGAITPAPLTVVAKDATTFIGVAPNLTGAYSVIGLQGADTASQVLASASVSSNTGTSSNAGVYAGTLVPSATLAANSNYSTPTLVNGTLTIAGNYQLVITAGNNSAVYGVYGATNQSSAVSTATAKYCTNCAVGTANPTYVNLTVTGSGSSWTAVDSVTDPQNPISYAFAVNPVVAAASYSVGSSVATGRYIKVGAYAITPSDAVAVDGVSNLDPNLPVIYNSGALTVTPFIISANSSANNPASTVSGLSQQYNGQTGIANTALTLSGVPSGVALTATGSGSFGNPNAAGTGGSALSINNLVLSGADAANFAFAGPLTGTGTITPAPITVTSSNVVKVFDNTLATSGANVSQLPTAVLVSGTLYANGGVQDTLSGGTFAFTDVNAGAGNKTVTVSAVSVLNGGINRSANYAITYINNTTSTITPAPLTVTGLVAANKSYDATTAATVSGSPILLGNTFGISLSVAGSATTGSFAYSDVADGIAVTPNISGLSVGNPNFVITGSTNLSANITPAPITISGLSAASKVYDTAADANITGTPIIAGNTFGLTLSLSGTVTAGTFVSPNAGNSQVVTPNLGLLTLNNPNFAIVGLTEPITANITPAPLTISGLSALAKTYDGTTAADLSGTPSLAGNVLGQSISLSMVGTSGQGIYSQSDAGSGLTITPNLAKFILSNPNFYIAGFTTPLTGDILPSLSSNQGSSASGSAGNNSGQNGQGNIFRDIPYMSFSQAVATNNQNSAVFARVAKTENGLPMQPMYRYKAEPIYVRDVTALTEHLLVIEPPLSGAFRFSVPDKTIQDLINISGNGFSGVISQGATPGVVKLLLLPHDSTVEATLVNGESLPEGIRFNASNKTFYIDQLSNINLPIEVKLSLKNHAATLAEKVILVTK